ncbi:putative phosphoribosyltransferase protein [Botrytis fragariae]|uniref:Putative phosphoribosyltransferase protein n=1 Tax=Botrytis fragariae TaxID=1964551 RepID=A0A8H6B4Q4_9HELO|nr:putative phosphoribosyltransferase protein [Botrytis fragariae]KAF5879384.1 putative phosphoribosyltransferase protein [Botrytis fragariae]
MPQLNTDIQKYEVDDKSTDDVIIGENAHQKNPDKNLKLSKNLKSIQTTANDSSNIPNQAVPPITYFTEPTTTYWQSILSSSHTPQNPPYKYGFAAKLPDSRFLVLPIRPLKDNPKHAVASLLVNQASMEVVDILSDFLADLVRRFEPDAIIGLPTLGLSLAPLVARNLGLKRYIPLGYSRKFWYDDALSASVSSITSPELGLKKVYLDPHQLPLVLGKRCVIIDDAVSSGATLKTTWDLLEKIGCDIVACGVVMKQGNKWEQRIGQERVDKLVYVLESPLLENVDEGWVLRS